ncbi:hypothetical protein ABB37_04660 [Leptomonas pyrrhocoris]|uniref:Uncharacterized protein n=1 Tax=Leptomonas pyrrhocoris TaxID=157538 RepID=A0A0N0VFE1_LEPPY|nr:hypothetical protein ABB37_04660 [Leptomonas pyrrhocoris]XP_015658864.1 hypothetical protein ABB37_04660 [Leptomonas pyrrhocoris]KPA80424.1 hypothetical protein ABB37_04660 [Leptomonas pyrrhocoris]KPA80425.1 hypothetical protein ABB37_04660 [Leptomonas pyrrhocoris]|eukprot:XP_015658863.1 hypothetical protein ABB37_04660 [Leptomonas pyrrhocoris]
MKLFNTFQSAAQDITPKAPVLPVPVILLLLDALLVVPQAAFSVYHYYRTRGSVGDKIPIHFGINGSPDSFAASSYFCIYPALNVLIAFTSIICANYVPALFGVLFSITMGTSLLLLCITQHYCGPISRGELTQIPSIVFYPSLVLIFLSTIALIIYAIYASSS